MKPEDRPPAFVEDRTSVNWKVTIDAWHCCYLDWKWCRRNRKDCTYNNCDLKIEGSFNLED